MHRERERERERGEWERGREWGRGRRERGKRREARLSGVCVCEWVSPPPTFSIYYMIELYTGYYQASLPPGSQSACRQQCLGCLRWHQPDCINLMASCIHENTRLKSPGADLHTYKQEASLVNKTWSRLSAICNAYFKRNKILSRPWSSFMAWLSPIACKTRAHYGVLTVQQNDLNVISISRHVIAQFVTPIKEHSLRANCYSQYV